MDSSGSRPSLAFIRAEDARSDATPSSASGRALPASLLLGVFLAGLIVRFAFGWRCLVDSAVALTNDSPLYRSLASDLLHGTFPGLFRTPGYPLFLALTGGETGSSLTFAILAQFVVDSEAVYLEDIEGVDVDEHPGGSRSSIKLRNGVIIGGLTGAAIVAALATVRFRRRHH